MILPNAFGKTSFTPNIYVYMDFALKSWLPVLNQELNALDLILPMCNRNTTHNIGLNTNFLFSN